MAVELSKPGEAPPPAGTRVKVSSATAEPGAAPAGMVVEQVRATIKVHTVDPYLSHLSAATPGQLLPYPGT